MKLIGGWHCYLILSPRKIQRENLLALKYGKAHLRKNPVRKAKANINPEDFTGLPDINTRRIYVKGKN